VAGSWAVTREIATGYAVATWTGRNGSSAGRNLVCVIAGRSMNGVSKRRGQRS
jgi:hypothetical protein